MKSAATACSAAAPATGTILDDHAKAAGVADAAYRRRQHRDQKAFLNFRQPAIELGLDRRADWRGSRARFSNGSSIRKIAPELGALVKVAPEKPTTLTPWATPGTPSAMSSARCCTASVRASDAAGGS